jgi:hypothetical protein
MMAGKCAACTKTVYPNDSQISLDGSVYHKPCAKCADCNCQITLANFTKSGTTLLCKTHYFKRFHEEGAYVGGDKFSRMSARDIKLAGTATPGVSEESHAPTPGSTAPAAVVSDEPVVSTPSNDSPGEETAPKESSAATSALRARFEKKTSEPTSPDGEDKPKRRVSISTSALKCTQCSKTIYPNDPQIVLGLTKFIFVSNYSFFIIYFIFRWNSIPFALC